METTQDYITFLSALSTEDIKKYQGNVGAGRFARAIRIVLAKRAVRSDPREYSSRHRLAEQIAKRAEMK